ncbi:efflux RND transporter permease subunit [Methylobacterium oxalidis]|uniref:Multidrug transporter n=1 Tax=Methylobacterium oxalidis TaxID=944322 RepID=A0A512J5Q7_9HYPH|nr:efflux RND transporter permease subunit [Methylobacterium oxalidis]GEP05317.1 multidrug transporter [Methylobacterium oxalidis]GJE31328.1 Multidrug resistance protein MdtB [Methylobacterium oxalidis]GLS63544.1 multidrug transporter [Methylobacterium oxalidis]
MNLAAPFVRRPVAAILLGLALLCAGLASYRLLPVAALPRVEFPVILVSAQLPGASPETMAGAVATPLIREFAALPSLQAMSATNTTGTSVITLEFALHRDIEGAAADVQAALARAQRHLPTEMLTAPSYRKFNPADAPVLLVALTSRALPLPRLDALARTLLAPALSAGQGVGQVVLHGGQKRAVRIRIDPQALVARDLGPDAVEQAIRAANAQTAVGTLTDGQRRAALRAPTQFEDAAGFRELIVASRGGRPLRLGEIASIVDSVEDDQAGSWLDGEPALVLAVHREPGSSAVAVSDAVRRMLPRLGAEIGGDVALTIVNDHSGAIREGVGDVLATLLATSLLVVTVIHLFGGGLGTTLIAGLAVPLSVAGTFAAMLLLGFSLNAITLLALTLSVGLVVDDAIVMLEGYQHHREAGLGPVEAALRGAREMAFTIVSVTVSLIAAFIPVLFMGGLVGRIFHEFAVTVCVALAISALVSLTLTPALAGLLPGGPARETRSRRAFARVLALYGRSLDWSLRHRGVVVLLFLATLAGTAALGRAIPRGLFPQEDLSLVTVSTEARADISFPAMAALQARVDATLRASPHVAHVVSSIGGPGANGAGPNQGRVFVELRPRAERAGLDTVLADLRRSLDAVPGIASLVTPYQNLRGGRQGRSQYQFAVQGADLEEIGRWSARLAEAMGRDPAFVGVTTDLRDAVPQVTLRVDRDRARLLGIGSDQLRSVLNLGFGPRQVATIQTGSDIHPVLVEFAKPPAGQSVDLDGIRLRASGGALVPLSAFATAEPGLGLQALNQIGLFPGVTVSFDLARGVSLGEAVRRIEALRGQAGLPGSVTVTFLGSARTFQESAGSQGLLVLAALLAVYVILGILYGSLSHPLTILAGLPAAALGALLALAWAGLSLDLTGVIGILLLIGVVKKNAIMVIDAALGRLQAGAKPAEAIREASLRRFRPIVMTSLVAIVGAVPLAVGFGASPETRQPLGIAVLGGLVLSQVLTLYVTPVLFLCVQGVSERAARLVRRTAHLPRPSR